MTSGETTADGGVLDKQVPQPRPKHPGHANGLFSVCAPFESGGRRQQGKRMRPLRYRGLVVGMRQFAVELLKEQERVRQLGLKNRANVADPNKKSWPRVWYDHCDPGVNPYEVSSWRATTFLIPNTNLPFFSSLATAQGGCRSCPRSSASSP